VTFVLEERPAKTPSTSTGISLNYLPVIKNKEERIPFILYTIAVILVVLWLLGLITSYTMGGFVHVLLVIAIVVVLLRVIRGKNVFGTSN
jgi:hypothetical protein